MNPSEEDSNSNVIAETESTATVAPSESHRREIPKLYFTEASFEDAVHPDVQKTFHLPQTKQRTPEWYEAREHCITASPMAAALKQVPEVVDYYIECFPQAEFKPKPDKSCAFKDTELDLIMSKCGLGDVFKGNGYTAWGQKYEEVVSNIYAQLNQVDVLEFGLLRHPRYPFVGASPDGIAAWPLADGSIPMLEIKCPSAREAKNYPTLYYFIQTLIQMACVDLDAISVTDYFDANFIQYHDVGDWGEAAEQWETENPDAMHHIFGIILEHDVIDEDDKDGATIVKHIYAPPTVRKKDDFLSWALSIEMDDELTQYRRTYYKLHRYYISRVRYNKDWFMANLPAILAVWNKIQHYRTPEGQLELKDILAQQEEAREQRRVRKRLRAELAAQSMTADDENTIPEECLL